MLRHVQSLPVFSITWIRRLNDERVQALLFVSRAVWGSRQIVGHLVGSVFAENTVLVET